MKNRIYFFTGTGNSLKVAKDIAASIDDCEIVAICKGASVDVPDEIERIGFVFPVYFFGLPNMVADFLRKINIKSAKYLFAIATPGGVSGKPLAQAEMILSKKGVNLNYGKKIRMSANYIIRYGPIWIFNKTAMKWYDKRINSIIHDVKSMKSNKIEKHSKRIEATYEKYICNVHDTDKGFHTNADCVACGICVNVCPAKNIKLEEGLPVFNHRCESCVACIQYCPKKAINYENKTQKRKRYTHPDVKHSELSNYYKQSINKNNV
ncbi:MAG: EFR1 family ferrodoxin [Defluviitaleaceae bacterium]|nr:EFR1 family ferrodoxin [Defluviitaleaceae bacterium]